MSFSSETIQYLSHLARLSFENNQIKISIQEDLTRIVAIFDQIAAAKTDEIQAMAHPLDTQQPLRVDEVTAKNELDSLLSLAPQKEAGLFLVPQVLE